MPRSRNSYKCERCRASQRYYTRPRYPDSGHGECCRYERAQSVDGNCRPTVNQEEMFPTVSARCPKFRTPSRSAQDDSLQDSGYDDSSSRSSCLDESDLSMSAVSATSATSMTSTSSTESIATPTAGQQSAPFQCIRVVNQLVIMRRDLELCRQAFQNVFRSLNQSEFKDICCAVSCVYSSARPLSRHELAAATNLYSLGREWRRSIYDEQWTQLDQWIHKCDSIFVENSDGKIDFVRPTSMRTFLRNVRIPGIDTSHRTLGMVCRNQTELQRFLLRNGIARPDLVEAVQTMSSYVKEFGEHDLQAASLTSMIAVASDDSCTVANDDFEMISTGTSKLSIGEGRNDWVVVKQS